MSRFQPFLFEQYPDPVPGQVFGRWTFTGQVGFDKKHKMLCQCRCICGSERLVARKSLVDGGSRSCGCYAREMLAARNRERKGKPVSPRRPKNGEEPARGRLGHIWHGIKQRCYNPNKTEYARYGGRGIAMCEEWRDSFTAFRAWAEGNGYGEGLTIERKDVNGDYAPFNCRWAGIAEQARNTRRSNKISAFGECKCFSEWLRDSRCVVTKNTLRRRIRLGMNTESALSLPARSAPLSEYA